MDNVVVYPKFRWVVALATAWAWFSFGVTVLVLSPLLPAISTEFGRQIGFLAICVFASNSLAIGVGVISSGALVDKIGPRKTLLWSAILMLLYCLLIPVGSHSIAGILALRILLGLALGPLFSSQAALIHRWFPVRERGIVFGINNGVFAAGSGAVFLSFSYLMTAFHGDWRMVAFVAPTCVLVVQVILMTIILFAKEPAQVWQSPAAGAPPNRDFRIALLLPVFWAGAFLLGLDQGIMQGFQNLTSSYLMTPPPMGLGWQPWVAGPCLTFTQIGMLVSGLLMGFVLLYVFRGSCRWLASVSFLLAGLAIFSISQPYSHTSPKMLCLFLFLVGALMNLEQPAILTFITQNYPPQILGRVCGLSSGLSVFGGAAVTAIGGLILDATHTYVAVYGFILAVGVVGSIVTAIMLNPVKAFKRVPEPIIGD